MALDRITYPEKTAGSETSTEAKFFDSEANEIKTVVNAAIDAVEELQDEQIVSPNPFYGRHDSIELLEAAYPTGEENAWAIIDAGVGVTPQIAAWDDIAGEWEITGYSNYHVFVNTAANLPATGEVQKDYITLDDMLVRVWHNGQYKIKSPITNTTLWYTKTVKTKDIDGNTDPTDADSGKVLAITDNTDITAIIFDVSYTQALAKAAALSSSESFYLNIYNATKNKNVRATITTFTLVDSSTKYKLTVTGVADAEIDEGDTLHLGLPINVGSGVTPRIATWYQQGFRVHGSASATYFGADDFPNGFILDHDTTETDADDISMAERRVVFRAPFNMRLHNVYFQIQEENCAIAIIKSSDAYDDEVVVYEENCINGGSGSGIDDNNIEGGTTIYKGELIGVFVKREDGTPSYIEAQMFVDFIEVGTVTADDEAEYTLPLEDGTNGQVLKTNGSGTVSWQDESGGGSSPDDTAYDATSWNDNTDAATKNALRDKFVTIDDSFDYLQEELNTENLFNKETIVEGYYGSGGVTFIPSGSLWTSDFIEVTEGEIYKTTNDATTNIYMYDASQDPHTPAVTATTQLTIPSGVAYVKVLFDSSKLDVVMFTLNSVDTGSYIPFSKVYIKDDVLQNPYTAQDVVNAADTEDFKERLLVRTYTENLFNKRTIVEGYYGTNGTTFQSDATFHTSDYIPVVEGETYRKSNDVDAFIYMYDEGKTPHSPSYINDTTITIPSGVAFVRVIYYADKLDVVMFTLDSVDTTHYIPHILQTVDREVVLPQLQEHVIIKKVAYWLGDSMTASGTYYLNDLRTMLSFSKEYNLANSGAKWSHGATTAYDITTTGSSIADWNCIWNQANKMKDLVDNSSYLDPDVVIINCGTNDFLEDLGTPSTVYDGLAFTSLSPDDSELQSVAGGIRYTCETILEDFPDVQIILIAPIQRGVADNSKIFSITDTMIECGGYNSIEVIDQARRCGIYGYPEIASDIYLADNLHTNAAGATKVAKFLSKALRQIIIDK
ncbi:SGNH/GDSL hydrolase family protein [Winogradskyella pulchriflava]|uniref:SGNH/GDSL hydrolase family protein n=1 Tax=Winogradskyella pulchriflava TaxID=1110688 RepID=A0ABV6QCG4_9FLAO